MENSGSPSPIHIEVLTIGDELLDGVVADTNTTWLGDNLMSRGHRVNRCTTVRDHRTDIVDALKEIAQRADLCICTGGLGPTEDDLTVEALADALDTSLTHDENVWTDILRRYAPRTPPRNNRRQARIPTGADVLRSLVGTAPGIAAQLNGCQVFVFPGVPAEFKWFVETFVLPRIDETHGQHGVTATLRFSGIGESNLATQVNAIQWPSTLSIGYRTAMPENHVRVRAPDVATLERAVQKIIACAPSHFVGRDQYGLVHFVLDTLRKRGLTLGTAESCTGGLIAGAITAVPGASDVFSGSVVSYSETVKHNILEVEQEVLDTTGVYSEACARQMAIGARRQLGTDWMLAVTGLAGPTGGDPDIPVGMVCFAWVGPEYEHTDTRVFRGNREQIRRRAVGYALDGIRKYYGNRTL